MPQVFISYRREDTSGHVGRLQEGLRKELGSKNVFMDVDSIQPGVDFERAIRAAVSRSDYVLVVIGKDWLVTTNPQGQRRLDDPHDYVRLELIYALESEARIVPILVKGAQMPREEELPEPLRILSKQQCVELRDARWNADFMDLIAHLGGSPLWRWMRRNLLISVLSIFLLTLAVILVTDRSLLEHIWLGTVDVNGTWSTSTLTNQFDKGDRYSLVFKFTVLGSRLLGSASEVSETGIYSVTRSILDGRIERNIISFAVAEKSESFGEEISYKDYYNGTIAADHINFILTSDRPWAFAPQDFVAVRKKE